MIKQKDLILYSGLIILGLAAPFLFSAFKVQLTYPVSYTHLTLPTKA